MRKFVFSLVVVGVLLGFSVIKTPLVYAQRLSTVGIMPFESAGALANDAANLTRQVIQELSSWGTLTILTDAEAETAEYIVKGTLIRSGGAFVLSATTTNANTKRVLNEAKEQGPNVNAISIFNFCTKVVENVPFPNYLLGKWQSIISLPDSQVVCVIEFKTDRTVNVEQYDTWEHRDKNALKYEGFGKGTYSYAGYLRRSMTVGNRQILVDATASVNLSIEEALTGYTKIEQGGLRLLFDDARNSFEIVSGGLPCGRNYDGSLVYPAERLYFTRFSKIQ